MKIKIKTHIHEFNALLNIIEKINMETDFSFEKEGMFVRVVEPGNFSLAMINVPTTFFDEYDVEKSETFTLNTTLFRDLVDRCSKDVEIIPEDNYLIVKNGRHKYKMKYFVGRKDDRAFPDREYKDEWKVSSDEFFDIVNGNLKLGAICYLSGGEKLMIGIKSNQLEGLRMVIRKHRVYSHVR